MIGSSRLGRQDAQNAIRVAHGRHLGVGDHQGVVGEVRRHQRARFDTGGGIADNVLELHLGEIVQYLFDAFLGEGVFVAGLRSREDIQVLQLLVADQRLVQRGFSLDDVHEVVDDPALATHDEIEVAQPDVEVDDHGFVTSHCKASRETCTGGRLADAAFAGCHHNDSRHDGSIPLFAINHVIVKQKTAIPVNCPMNQFASCRH